MRNFRLEYCDPREYDDAGFLRIYVYKSESYVKDQDEVIKVVSTDALHSISMADIVELLGCIDPKLDITYLEPEDV